MRDNPTSSWVTVAEAAERAGVDSSTVRQWYRSGKIPTRRAEGERGAFLVPLDSVLGLVPSNGSAELVQQVDFLREQLAELSQENRILRQRLKEEDERRADLRARLADTEDELAQLRKVAARSSITDNSWLDQKTPAYQSPVRAQGSPAAAAIRAVPKSGELADMLAATRPDGEDEATPEVTAEDWAPAAAALPTVGPHALDGEDDEAPFIPPRPVPSSEPAAYGTHEDDLLPEPEKRGRRSR